MIATVFMRLQPEDEIAARMADGGTSRVVIDINGEPIVFLYPRQATLLADTITGLLGSEGEKEESS